MALHVPLAAVLAAHRDLLPEPRRLIRSHARSADGRIQQSGDGQGIVPDRFGFQPNPGAPSKQPIVRITFK